MFYRLYYYLLAICLLCSFILFSARTFTNVWLLDVIVSFLPLVTLGTVLVFIATFVSTVLYFKKISRQKAKLQKWLIGIILLASCSSWVASMIQVTSALDNTVLAHERDLTTARRLTLQVGFFNKYYYNEALDPIVEEVTARNLDIFGIAELSEPHYQTLRTELNMPYSYYDNCHCFNIMGDPIALFSKYPLNDIKVNGIERAGIIEASVTISETQTVHLIVTHPDAPMGTEIFKKRNEQYQQLDALLQNYRDKPLLVMGDFNLSSWSPTFLNLLRKNTFLKDSARGFGLLTTWGPSFIRTKIDHLLISQNIGVIDFQTVTIQGSDHSMIYASLGL